MKRIVIDMDEVIADTYQKLIDCYEADFGTRLIPADYKGKKVYDLPNAGYIRNYLYDAGFFADIPVMADSQRVVKQLQKQYEIYIVTTAQEFRNSLSDKWDWLQEHFPFIPYSNIVMCGKKDIIQADYMIDDKVRNLSTFKGKGLLFTSPHNVYDIGYVRVNSWVEVEHFFSSENP